MEQDQFKAGVNDGTKLKISSNWIRAKKLNFIEYTQHLVHKLFAAAQKGLTLNELF